MNPMLHMFKGFFLYSEIIQANWIFFIKTKWTQLSNCLTKYRLYPEWNCMVAGYLKR